MITEKIKTLQIIHLAICIGSIIAYIMVGNLSINSLRVPEINSSTVIFLGIPIVGYLISNLLFKSQLKQANTTLEVEENMSIYTTASIIRWSLLEAAAFAILFVKPDFIIFGAMLLLYLAALRPTIQRVKNDLVSVSNN